MSPLFELRPLSLEDIERAVLWRGGCPRCGHTGFSARQNGVGPHVECPGDCSPEHIFAAADGILAIADKLHQDAEDAKHRKPLEDLEARVHKHAPRDGLVPPFRELARYGEGAAYELSFKGDDKRIVRLGNATDLGQQAKFLTAFRKTLDVELEPFTRNEWQQVKQLILDAKEDRDDLDSEIEEVQDWIDAFAAREHEVGHDRASAIANSSSFVDEGRLHLRPDQLIRWLARDQHVHVKRSELVPRLRRLGYTPDQLSVRDDDKSHKARYWIAPTPSVREEVSISRGDSGDMGTRSRGAEKSSRANGDAAGTTGDGQRVQESASDGSHVQAAAR